MKRMMTVQTTPLDNRAILPGNRAETIQPLAGVAVVGIVVLAKAVKVVGRAIVKVTEVVVAMMQLKKPGKIISAH